MHPSKDFLATETGAGVVHLAHLSASEDMQFRSCPFAGKLLALRS